MPTSLEERELKLRELLSLLPNSPLYRDKLEGYDTSRIALADIRSLPLTTKAELRTAGAFGYLAVPKEQIAQYHESTGTTGEPSVSWFTLEDIATGGRQLRECGVNLASDDLVLIRFPYAMSLPAFLMQDACWATGAGIVPASGRTVVTPYPRVLELMKRLGVTVIAGLPREMELLAEAARLLGQQPSWDYPSLRAICVAGELLSDARRRHIERLWGVPVFNMYGSTETANIAVMCEQGVLHVREQDFIVEVLTEDGGHSVAEGERGYAAITTLSHRASPLLRYYNEDIVAVAPHRCSCGRSGASLTHYGRAKDRMTFGTTTLDAHDVQEAVYSLVPAPDAWKVIEQERGLHVLLDSHRSEQWSEESVGIQLSRWLRVPVTVEIAADGVLLDRDGLLRNVPSTKPIYIQRFARTADPVRELLDRGRELFMSGDYSGAKTAFEEAIVVNERNAESHAWLAAAYGRLIEAGNMQAKIKLLPIFENEVRTALEIDPLHPFARRMNGSRLLNTPESLGGNPALAAEEFQYSLAHGLDDADLWVQLGQCYVKLGRGDQALEAIQAALRREPDHRKARRLMEALQEEDE
ncbi:AMP-binding protein [Cohnella panacarvi]|uniref:AMP-binding protein n=1 Tax=Cohnella panacarvi TaxID=400776 RepID=UPI0004789AE4|nr:AMP-binding protein [Cohnella panacarvi]